MNPLELTAVILGVCNIALLIRRSIWNFPFGIAMVALYFLIFLEARFYSQMVLQVFFAVVQVAGWIAWARTGGLDGPVAVNRLPVAERWLWPAGIVIGTAFWGWAVAELTDAAAPWWDAAIAIGSVAAQLLLVRRMIENWLVWMLVNLLAIRLYWETGYLLTAGLYALFLVMCVIGWLEWRKAERGAEPASA